MRRRNDDNEGSAHDDDHAERSDRDADEHVEDHHHNVRDNNNHHNNDNDAEEDDRTAHAKSHDEEREDEGENNASTSPLSNKRLGKQRAMQRDSPGSSGEEYIYHDEQDATYEPDAPVKKTRTSTVTRSSPTKEKKRGGRPRSDPVVAESMVIPDPRVNLLVPFAWKEDGEQGDRNATLAEIRCTPCTRCLERNAHCHQSAANTWKCKWCHEHHQTGCSWHDGK